MPTLVGSLASYNRRHDRLPPLPEDSDSTRSVAWWNEDEGTEHRPEDQGRWRTGMPGGLVLQVTASVMHSTSDVSFENSHRRVHWAAWSDTETS